MVWGTEFGSDTVFAFFPDSGTFLEYFIQHSNSGVGYISIEPTTTQVRIWFTETLRNANGEFVYDLKTGNVTLYEDKFPAAVGGGAYGVYAGASSVWFAGFSSIVRWDRGPQQYTIWPLPVHGTALGRFITVDSSGQVWYTQGGTNGTSNDNFVGVLSGDLFREWRLPTLGADPRGICMNPVTQEPWIAERSPAAGNGTVATLGNFTDGAFVSAPPTTASSAGTPFILGPSSNIVAALNSTASPSSNQIASLSDIQFIEYGLRSSQPHDVIVDSAGDTWISEPGANKIARLSGFSPDFALNASPPIISLSLGKSGTIKMTGTSLSGYRGSVTLTGIAPTGVTLSFNPGQVNIPTDENASSNVVIDVTSSALVGNSSVTIQGDDGSIAHSTSVLLIVTNSTVSNGTQKPQCVIATATYGSELSPEVELLRGFRDNSLRSRIGSSFLIMFNTWYYSFSPLVANFINDHAPARVVMKGVLYPLVGFLILASKITPPLSAYPEAATLLSGLLASMLIGGFYVGIPLGLISRKIRLVRRLSTRPWRSTLLGGLALLLIGEYLPSTVLLMLSTSIVVLSAMLLAATFAQAIISK
jgi:streptogramin lyase